jgi:hypothetical protein
MISAFEKLVIQHTMSGMLRKNQRHTWPISAFRHLIDHPSQQPQYCWKHARAGTPTMSTPEARKALQQSYAQRIVGFRRLFIANHQSQDHASTLPVAIALASDLIDDYGTAGAIAEEFSEHYKDEEFTRGMFGVFMNALCIEHDHFDRILEQIHLDHVKHFPSQMIARDAVSSQMMTYFPTATRAAHGEQRLIGLQPKLWGSDGTLLHNPDHFLTTHGTTVQNQLVALFEENGPALEMVLKSLPSLSDMTRTTIVDGLTLLVTIHHLSAQDPRRLAISPFTSVEAEVCDRLKSILNSLPFERKFQDTKIQTTRLFEVFQFLNIVEKERVLERIEDFIEGACTDADDHVDYSHAVHSYAEFLKQACWNGLGAKRVFGEIFGTKTKNNQDVFGRVIQELPAKHADDYSGESTKTVLCAALIMIQADQTLLSCVLEGEALLSLYVLTGDEKYRNALKTPERSDHLLAHDLGL